MAGIATFADLKTRLLELIDRDDITDEQAGVLIQLFETQANTRLRVGPMECLTESTLDDNHINVPDDYLGLRSISILGSPDRVLAQVTYEDLVQLAGSNATTGKPAYYAMAAEQLRFFPAPDATYTVRLLYYRSLAPLSDANPSNWLLERYPSAYLYGAAAQSAPLLREDDRLGTWTSIYSAVLDSIEQDDAKRRFGGRMALPSFRIG